MILPSGVTHRIFWDISSQLNATTQLLVDALSHVCVARAFHPVAPPVSRSLLRSRGSPLYVRIRDKFGHMVLVVEHRGKRRQVELAGNCSVETLKETCLVGIPTIPTFSVCSSCAPSTPRSSTTDGSYVTTIYFPPRESRLPRFSI